MQKIKFFGVKLYLKTLLCVIYHFAADKRMASSLSPGNNCFNTSTRLSFLNVAVRRKHNYDFKYFNIFSTKHKQKIPVFIMSAMTSFSSDNAA